MKTTIIIVTYNRLELLKECIFCALHQNNTDVELVVVNNKSTDGTFEYLCELENDKIHCIHEEKNIGGAGGFHDGLKYANEYTDSKWFLLIDDDAMLDNNYLKRISEHISDGCGVYTGTVCVETTIDTRHRSRIKSGFVPEIEYKDTKFFCDVATFCGLLVSKEIVMKIGYPRKDFFIWEDDTEYCYRFHNLTPIANISGAYLNHKTVTPTYKVGKSMRDDWKLYYGFRNQLVIYRDYHQYKKLFCKIVKLIGKSYLLKIKSLFDETNREDFIYNSRIRVDAIKDMRANKMGKNPDY